MSRFLNGENATPSLAIIIFSQLLFLHLAGIVLALVSVESNVHIVYMGKRQHNDVELITSTHHDILASVLGSREASTESMVYSYKHCFSGFAAKLTNSQAQKIAELPGVVAVIPNQFYNLHTTRSWDYLGLSSNSPTNLAHDAKMGDGIIIGVLDTGVWPESEVFRHEELGQIPSKWKGFCQSGERFDAKNCNRKIIGARYFIDGFLAEYGRPFNGTEFQDVLSPRDTVGHGTHTASTAAGYFATKVSYSGLGFGTVRGGAPRARLAIYKVCWRGGECASADVLKGIDEAIHDGVDVISLSLGPEVPMYAEVDIRDPVNFASFHAVERGITVVSSGGNSGPTAESVTNTAPWVLTVAASSTDRSFPTSMTLGNNQTFTGQALFTGKDTGFSSLTYPEHSSITPPRYCNTLTPEDTWAVGHVVLCFLANAEEQEIILAGLNIKEAGALGMIVAKNPSKTLDAFNSDFPCVQVNYEIGTQILYYIRSNRNPQVRLRPSKAYTGKPVSTNVAYFSSRGPNSLEPAVLKPDIAAPGVNILAAIPPSDPVEKSAYEFESGTSMAAPHISGIVALLKSLHPDWSPAAIKSAIVTTAWTTDPSSGEPIFAEGHKTRLADPFDFGGGVVNPNKARFPGLVYDMGTADYLHYLCGKGYNNTAISLLLGRKTTCSSARYSVLDLNLPSITVPRLTSSVIVRRTVTNIGAVNSKYSAIIESPEGIAVVVKPNVLIFNSTIKKISFTVTMSTSYRFNTGFHFGSLTWTDGKQKVRSPISVKTEFPGN